MPLRGEARRSEAGLIYAALWAEIEPTLGGPRPPAPGALPEPAVRGPQGITVCNTDYVVSE